MITLLEVFVNNLLPILLSAGAGLVLGRAFRPDIKSITRLSFYIFSPCLVFASITQSRVSNAEFGQLSLFAVAAIVTMLLIAAIVGLALRLDRRTLATLVISAAFVNSGNYGLAALRFAFGEEALARGVVFYVVSTLSVYTLGVFVSSLGRGSPAQALKEVFTIPAFYALVAAGVIHWTGWSVPLFVDRAVTLLGEAAIPVMLVILGLQMAAMRLHTQADPWPRGRWVVIGVGAGLQLLAAPLMALALGALLGLDGVNYQAAVLEASMPAAVITTVLAVQYDLDADLTTATVVLSTLLSPLTLTPLILYLQTVS